MLLPPKVLIFACLFVVPCYGAPKDVEKLHKDKLDPKLVRLLLSNNFESGSMEPWYDESPGETHWVLETLNSPQEPTPVPNPGSGNSYLRIDRPEGYRSGLGVLYTPLWTANSGDKLSLSFWIKSRHTQGNTLDVYWLNGTREEKLLELSSFSSSSNNQWRTAEATIPVSAPTNTKLVIYGYCGPNEEDSIAIDNIVVGPGDVTTTTPAATTSHTNTVSIEVSTPSPVYCHYQLTDEWGYFSSPVDPSTGQYYNNLNCSWSIVAPSWMGYLYIGFNSFETERGFDFVRIYDGPTTSDYVLINHSGTDIPYHVDSSSTRVLITFTTDSSVTFAGFSGFYQSYSIWSTSPTSRRLKP